MNSNRIAWMDFARFFAMATVVALHTTDQLMMAHRDLSELQWSAYQIFRIIGRTGVPIFLMISGALVLPKIGSIGVLKFYKKRIPQFFLVLIFYFYATNTFISFIHGAEFKFSDLEYKIFHGDMSHAYQLWFMFTIIGLYFVAPFIGRMLSLLSTKETFIYLALCLIAYYLPVSQGIIFGSQPFYTLFNGEFLGTYLAYFVIGYLIHNRDVAKNISAWALATMLLVSIAVMLYIQHYLKSIGALEHGEGFTWYNSVGIFIVSSLLFSLLSKIKDSSIAFASKPLNYLSASSFCVYLFHLIPLEVFLMMPAMKSHSVLLSAAMIACSTYLCCLVFYAALHKIKYVRKLVI